MPFDCSSATTRHQKGVLESLDFLNTRLKSDCKFSTFVMAFSHLSTITQHVSVKTCGSCAISLKYYNLCNLSILTTVFHSPYASLVYHEESV